MKRKMTLLSLTLYAHITRPDARVIDRLIIMGMSSYRKGRSPLSYPHSFVNLHHRVCAEVAKNQTRTYTKIGTHCHPKQKQPVIYLLYMIRVGDNIRSIVRATLAVALAPDH